MYPLFNRKNRVFVCQIHLLPPFRHRSLQHRNLGFQNLAIPNPLAFHHNLRSLLYSHNGVHRRCLTLNLRHLFNHLLLRSHQRLPPKRNVTTICAYKFTTPKIWPIFSRPSPIQITFIFLPLAKSNIKRVKCSDYTIKKFQNKNFILKLAHFPAQRVHGKQFLLVSIASSFRQPIALQRFSLHHHHIGEMLIGHGFGIIQIVTFNVLRQFHRIHVLVPVLDATVFFVRAPLFVAIARETTVVHRASIDIVVER